MKRSEVQKKLAELHLKEMEQRSVEFGTIVADPRERTVSMADFELLATVQDDLCLLLRMVKPDV